MLRVGVVGAAGRMGRCVCEAVTAAAGMELVAAVDPAGAGVDLRELVGPDAPPLVVAGEIESLAASNLSVVVDFTAAKAAQATLRWCADNAVHAVVGTTGLSEADLSEAERLFAQSSANAVIASNFAIGAALLIRFCEL